MWMLENFQMIEPYRFEPEFSSDDDGHEDADIGNGRAEIAWKPSIAATKHKFIGTFLK